MGSSEQTPASASTSTSSSSSSSSSTSTDSTSTPVPVNPRTISIARTSSHNGEETSVKIDISVTGDIKIEDVLANALTEMVKVIEEQMEADNSEEAIEAAKKLDETTAALKAAEEARLKLEAEAKEAELKAAAEAEEARLKAEAELKAAEEARLKAEAEAEKAEQARLAEEARILSLLKNGNPHIVSKYEDPDFSKEIDQLISKGLMTEAINKELVKAIFDHAPSTTILNLIRNISGHFYQADKAMEFIAQLVTCTMNTPRMPKEESNEIILQLVTIPVPKKESA